MPVSKVSTNPNPEARKKENKDFNTVYQQEVKGWLARKKKFDLNMSKAFAVVFGRCTKQLQVKIANQSDYNSKIQDNTIELLKAIEEHSTQFHEKKNPAIVMVDALKSLLNIKQKDNENLDDYARSSRVPRASISADGAMTSAAPGSTLR